VSTSRREGGGEPPGDEDERAPGRSDASRESTTKTRAEGFFFADASRRAVSGRIDKAPRAGARETRIDA
jgi:hypothetical protein